MIKAIQSDFFCWQDLSFYRAEVGGALLFLSTTHNPTERHFQYSFCSLSSSPSRPPGVNVGFQNCRSQAKAFFLFFVFVFYNKGYCLLGACTHHIAHSSWPKIWKQGAGEKQMRKTITNMKKLILICPSSLWGCALWIGPQRGKSKNFQLILSLLTKLIDPSWVTGCWPIDLQI